MHCAALGAAVAMSSSALATIIGTDYGGGNVPTNWNSYAGGGNQFLENLINENGDATGVDLDIFTTGGGMSDFDATINIGTIPQHTTDLTGLDNYVFEGGGSVFTATYSDLEPGVEYYVWAFGLRAFDYDNVVTIRGGGPDIEFRQQSGPNNLYVNDQLGSSSMDLYDYALIQTADSAGQIQIITVLGPSGTGAAFASGGSAIELVPAPSALALLGLAGFATRRRR
jgi:hypothetical protein